MELPGVDPKDVEISLTGDLLTISGEKKSVRKTDEAGESRKVVHFSESRYGRFQRAFRLPKGVSSGDVKATYADVSALAEAVGYRPKVSLEEGMKRFVDWYRGFYHL